MYDIAPKAQNTSFFGDGLPLDQSSPIVGYMSWEFLIALTVFVFLLGVIAITMLYGSRPWEELWHKIFPRRVKGLFLRAEVDLVGVTGARKRDSLVGYVTTLSSHAARFISDEKIPVGSRVHLKLDELPDRLLGDGDLYGVVRASHLHVRGGEYFENKVELSAIPQWDDETFGHLLDRLEANYSAA